MESNFGHTLGNHHIDFIEFMTSIRGVIIC
jgi:hypothetical protein